MDDDLVPFKVPGPVKYYKILSAQEKQELFRKGIIQSSELRLEIRAYLSAEKVVMGYEVGGPK